MGVHQNELGGKTSEQFLISPGSVYATGGRGGGEHHELSRNFVKTSSQKLEPCLKHTEALVITRWAPEQKEK